MRINDLYTAMALLLNLLLVLSIEGWLQVPVPQKCKRQKQ